MTDVERCIAVMCLVKMRIAELEGTTIASKEALLDECLAEAFLPRSQVDETVLFTYLDQKIAGKYVLADYTRSS